MNGMPRLYLPMRKACDVKNFLASPDQYRPGYSAQCVAESWSSANGLPCKMKKVLTKVPRFGGVELVDAFLERRTSLHDPWRPSQSDVLAVLGLPSELALMTVEGKVRESFGPLISELVANETNENAMETTDAEPPKPTARQLRLTNLKRTLGLDEKETKDLRYQLLHRTASAIFEAQRYRARVAVMMVQSFDPINTGLSDLELFASRMDISGANRLVGPVKRDGVDLYLGWTPNG